MEKAKPQAYVILGTTKRPGKGFSLGEIEAAGLHWRTLKANGIKVDTRRNSVNQMNVDILKSVGDLDVPITVEKIRVQKATKPGASKKKTKADTRTLEDATSLSSKQLEKLSTVGITTVQELKEENIDKLAKAVKLRSKTLQKALKEAQKSA